MTSTPRDWVVAISLVAVVFVATPGDCTVTLRYLDTTFIPTSYDAEGSPSFAYNKGAVNRLAFQHTKKQMYVAGDNAIHLVDYSVPTDLRRSLHRLSDPGEKYTGVDVCDNLVVASARFLNHSVDGVVYVISNNTDILQRIKIGPHPAMVMFTPDCSKIIVPLTGEVTTDEDDNVIDPYGAVGIITLQTEDATMSYDIKIANFSSFNENWEEHVEEGVRYPLRGNEEFDTTFAQGLEPTFVTMNVNEPDLAFVCLPWNNAIASVHINEGEIVKLYPLGAVSWKTSALDPSDQDGGIHLGSWDINGMYQSVAAKAVTVDGNNYLLTADGGSSKTYSAEDLGFDWTDNMAGNDLVSEELVNVSDVMINHLTNDSQLGRLFFSNTDGESEQGGIDKLYTFGGRSFSVFQTNDMKRLYNSKNSLENLTAETYPFVFNSNAEDEFTTPMKSMDSESRFKGPFPQSVEYAELTTEPKKKLIFVGMGCPGMVGIYSLPDNFADTNEAVLESLQYHGGDLQDTWGYSWEERVSRDLDVSDLKVLDASRSTNDQLLLAVAGRATGTVSLYTVYDDEEDRSTISGLTTFGIITLIVLCVAIVIGLFFGVRYMCRKHRLRNEYPRPSRLEEDTDHDQQDIPSPTDLIRA